MRKSWLAHALPDAAGAAAARPHGTARTRLRVRALALVSVLVLTLALTLAGCGVSLDAPAPDRDEVLAFVDDACPSEDYEIVSVEETCALPQQVTYTLRSTERDLTFTAVSEIVDPEPSYIPWPTFPYERISCDYPSVVSDLYRSRAESLRKSQLDRARPGTLYLSDVGHLCFQTYDDLKALVDICQQVDALYHHEYDYNDPAWCREHITASFAVIRVLGLDEDGEPHDWETLDPHIDLNGSFDGAAALDELARSYAQLIANGALPSDPALPARHLEGRHRAVLSGITIDGVSVPFAFGESNFADGNPYQREAINSGDACAARWDDERGCYRIYLHIGRYEQVEDGRALNPSSWLMEHIAQITEGTYTADAQGCRWECNGVAGSIEPASNLPWEHDAATLVFTAPNAREEQVGLANNSGVYTGPVFSYVDLDVFARLIGCTYTVDEDTGSIAFTTQGAILP